MTLQLIDFYKQSLGTKRRNGLADIITIDWLL